MLDRESITEHLEWWGLRRFESDAAYFQWQREALSPQTLSTLNRLVEQKRAPRAGIGAEVAFYDYAARPDVLPVLYSQQYDYYQAIGPAVVERVHGSRSILDFGCGIGLLTTFYARHCPAVSVMGVDRSEASLAVARERGRALGLENLRFECLDVQHSPLSGTFDLIVATHALVQSESDPGLPSQSWRTFDRPKDPAAQADFEQRTGLKTRLDHVCQALTSTGHLIAFEKTRQLARRIPLQRAFAARGLRLLEQPMPIRYRVVEEVAEDGPLFVLTRAPSVGPPHPSLEWDENPEPSSAEEEFYRHRGDAVTAQEDRALTPLYENHTPSAQQVWSRLPDRQVIKEATSEEPDGRQKHVELGTTPGLVYLYWANTFDQRQLVMVERQHASLLEDYYRELRQESP